VNIVELYDCVYYCFIAVLDLICIFLKSRLFGFIKGRSATLQLLQINVQNRSLYAS